MLGPFKYIEKTPNYDPLKWEKCTSEVVSGEAELMKHMSDLRQQHAQLVCELAAERDRRSPLKAFVNPVSFHKFVPLVKFAFPFLTFLDPEDHHLTYNLKFLSEITGEFGGWKNKYQ